MDIMKSNKELVLMYFNSWQKSDFDALASTLNDNVLFDLNGNKIEGANAFIEMCKNGVRWEKVDLVDSIFSDDKSALIYDGITETGEKVRVGEIVTVSNGKIINIVSAVVGNA